MTSKIICQCTGTTTHDVEKMISSVPNLNKDTLKHILKIGSRCGQCNRPGSPNIEVFFDDFYEIVTKNVRKVCK